MFRQKLAKRYIAAFLVTGMLLTGCGSAPDPVFDAAQIAKYENLGSVSGESHNTEKLKDDNYSFSDTVTYSYEVSMIDGLLTQKVSKEITARQNKTSGEWEVSSDKLTACEVDATKLPGSSWKCGSASSKDLALLFGDKFTSGDTGALYIRFLKKMGLFSFNLTNAKNTSDERFFETVGTNVKLVFAGASGNVEGKASVIGGSVTNSGELKLDLETASGTVNLNFGADVLPIQEREYDEATGNEVAAAKVYMDTLPVFGLTTTSLKSDGEWKTECGLKEGNLSPSLKWDPVDGATKYAVVMIDITTTRWLYWYTVVDKTDLAEGEFTDPAVYSGPYPAGTHTYEIHVIALKSEPKADTFKVDARSGDIQSFFDYVNTASDGSVGNVLAYGTIKAPYTSPELYYGYR